MSFGPLLVNEPKSTGVSDGRLAGLRDRIGEGELRLGRTQIYYCIWGVWWSLVGERKINCKNGRCEGTMVDEAIQL